MVRTIIRLQVIFNLINFSKQLFKLNISNTILSLFFLHLAIATAMKQANSKEFVEYQQQVVKNAQQLAKRLQEKGYKIVTNGTDNHIVWVDLRTVGLTGSKADKVLESVSIACNKNTVPGDSNALNPGGIRLGTPALTTRGLKEKDIDQVVEYLDRALKIAIQAKDETTGRLLKDFVVTIKQDKFQVQINKLREEIENYAENFFMPGYEV